MFIDNSRGKSNFFLQANALPRSRSVVSFISSKWESYRIRHKMAADIERLEATSPHLLADIGLADDYCAAKSEVTPRTFQLRGQV